MDTPAGKIPIVSTVLTRADHWGTVRVRLDIKRNMYRVTPGLYAVGSPTKDSPVLVTANYKLSFDMLRKELKKINAWIMVLDTNGVNVWCAAGKGTFGTIELLKRIYLTKLKSIVSHNTIILPQLGAVGVSAYEVSKKSGFKIIYGPVQAKDIPEFICNNFKATQEMRRISFNIFDRLVLTPLEMVHTWKLLGIMFVSLFLFNLAGGEFRGFMNILNQSIHNLLFYIGVVIAGCVVTPALLPWIPSRAFAVKGLLLGVLWSGFMLMYPQGFGFAAYSLLYKLGHAIIGAVISSYLALNFTGSTTYTSFSGVRKEVKAAAAPMLAAMIAALLFIAVSLVLLFV